MKSSDRFSIKEDRLIYNWTVSVFEYVNIQEEELVSRIIHKESH